MRGIIPGIVFKLAMQYGAYSAILIETDAVCKWQWIAFIMSTINIKDTKTLVIEILTWYKDY